MPAPAECCFGLCAQPRVLHRCVPCSDIDEFKKDVQLVRKFLQNALVAGEAVRQRKVVLKTVKKMEKTLHGPLFHTPSKTRQEKITAWNRAVRLAIHFYQSRPEIAIPPGRKRGSKFHAKAIEFYRQLGF